MKIEVGKYYVDGEGFYKVVEKYCSRGRMIVVEAVITHDNSVSEYDGLTYREEACERRFRECTQEQFEKAQAKAKDIIDELYKFNTEVFRPLI